VRTPGQAAAGDARLAAARLSLGDLARVASVGLRTRRLRAGLSALGIAIGVASIVAVLGLSSSSQAGLLSEIDRLGTNLLTVTKGQTFTGAEAQLPLSAPAMIERMQGSQQVADTGLVSEAKVYRSPLIPAIETNALQVQAASLNLLPVIATRVAQGRFLNAATAREPVAVLGAAAAQRLGIDRVLPGERIWLGGQWFYVAGILEHSELADEVDTSVLVGYPAARRYLNYSGTYRSRSTVGPPSTIYVRAETGQVDAVQALLAQTANPESPNEADVSQPSDALTARAAAKSALNGLFIGLGAVALLVGAVGVANIMIISVLERRSEIGLRRALGATRIQIRTQFLAEAIALALLGGAAGVITGALATLIYASGRGWSTVIPVEAWAGGIAAAIAIGALAGLLPAMRAASVSPTEALRTV
jgi:putative ABC transport system permease protein